MANSKDNNIWIWAIGGILAAVGLVLGPKLLNNNQPQPPLPPGTALPPTKKDCGCKMKKNF